MTNPSKEYNDDIKEPQDWEKEFDESFHFHNGDMSACDCDEIKSFIQSLLDKQKESIKEEMEKEIINWLNVNTKFPQEYSISELKSLINNIK